MLSWKRRCSCFYVAFHLMIERSLAKIKSISSKDTLFFTHLNMSTSVVSCSLNLGLMEMRLLFLFQWIVMKHILETYAHYLLILPVWNPRRHPAPNIWPSTFEWYWVWHQVWLFASFRKINVKYQWMSPPKVLQKFYLTQRFQ